MRVRSRRRRGRVPGGRRRPLHGRPRRRGQSRAAPRPPRRAVRDGARRRGRRLLRLHRPGERLAGRRGRRRGAAQAAGAGAGRRRPRARGAARRCAPALGHHPAVRRSRPAAAGADDARGPRRRPSGPADIGYVEAAAAGAALADALEFTALGRLFADDAADAPRRRGTGCRWEP
ncbi:hypothetical protein DN402_06200 [Streptomyces sp. SW4]|nr:hypothetical protein DN402_06200 [Streptomyces sp. SW4]